MLGEFLEHVQQDDVRGEIPVGVLEARVLRRGQRCAWPIPGEVGPDPGATAGAVVSLRRRGRLIDEGSLPASFSPEAKTAYPARPR